MTALYMSLVHLSKKILLLFGIILILLNQSSAQKSQFHFFSNADNISSPIIKQLYQDEDGFIWILGAKADRYDGYNFVPANGQKNGLPNFFNEDFYAVTSKGIIHKSDSHFYLQKLHNWQIDSIAFKKVLPEHGYFPQPFVHELVNGELLFSYIDSLSNSLHFLRLEGNQLVRHQETSAFAEKLNYYNFQLLSNSKGHFYLTDELRENLLQYSSDGQLLARIPLPDTEAFELTFRKIGGDTILFFSGNEVFELNNDTHSFQRHPVNDATASIQNINDIVSDKEGNLWICGHDRNLLFYHKEKGQIYNYKKELIKQIPRRIILYGLMVDQTGVVWIKTVLGVIKVVPQNVLFDTYFDKENPKCNGYCSFRGITEGDRGDIYASFYDGIFKIDQAEKTAENPYPNHFHTPRGLAWKGGKLLLNDGSMLDLKTGLTDPTVKPIRDYSMDIGELETDRKGIYWNAQNDSVYVLNDNTTPLAWESLFYIPDSKYRYQLHYGHKSEILWTGDGNRLFGYHTKDKLLTTSVPFSDRENIISIYEDVDGWLWLGMDNGLVHYNPITEKIKQHYTTLEGLSDNYVCGILPEGDSCLWFSTNVGLSRFSKKSKQFLNFYEQDGLTNNEFNRSSSYRAKDGQLFFGGIQGINAFYPEQIMKNYQHQKNIGKLVLSSFSRTDEKKQTIITELLNLNQHQLECYHWNKSITFEFTLSDYRNTAKNKYSYFLEGFENNWSTPTKYNFAKYPYLPAGEYTFRVKVLDAKGYWNPNELSIPLIVYPPWWLTQWAYGAYVFFAIALLYSGYRLLRYRINLENQYRFEQNEARRLKELDTFKSRLFTNITHEFRTPLTVILGMSEELLNSFKLLGLNKREQFTHQTELIQRNSQSLLDLVNQLLDLSKLQHKAFQPQLQNDDIIPFLNYVTTSFQAYANQQNIRLHFKNTLLDLCMDFDPNLLQQVIVNLISNAIKFTPSGGQITININRFQEEQNKVDFLVIMIQDSGIGIPSEKLKNIFDLFYQVDGSTTRHGEGTGIGLAHTKELIELMQGNISVESESGKGTVFRIQLPINNQMKPTAVSSTLIHAKIPIENRPISHDNISSNQKQNKNNTLSLLLLIEDNPDVISYLKVCLQHKYQIEIALNGQTGIEKALELIPDLIISDVMMPEKDGLEVCKLLKENEKTSHVPVILLTAKADQASRLAGLQKGADSYLSKPFHKEELLIRINNLLLRQQQMAHYFRQKYQENDSPPAMLPLINNAQLKTEEVFLQKLSTILEKHYMDKAFGLSQLCQKLRLSRSQLFRKLKALTGESPANYIKNYRLKQAKSLLENTDLNVSEVAWQTGFSSLSHFSRSFQAAFGETPSAISNSL